MCRYYKWTMSREIFKNYKTPGYTICLHHDTEKYSFLLLSTIIYKKKCPALYKPLFQSHMACVG